MVANSEMHPHQAVEADGFAIVKNVLSAEIVAQLAAVCSSLDRPDFSLRRTAVYAVRNLLEASPEVQALAQSDVLRTLVEPILGPAYRPVRGILFDKVPGANWKVPWHQDVTIAVQARVDSDGFGPWSVKAGVLHVQPPASILEQMISVRLHLDPCGENNGALRVVPGSHRQGRIPESAVASVTQQPEVVCAVESGGALLMRPLLLHASSPSAVPGHRRVIHLDFAAAPLPNGMRWLSEEA